MVVYYSKKNINTTVLSLFLIISILLRLTGSDNDSMIFRFLYNCPCIKVKLSIFKYFKSDKY